MASGQASDTRFSTPVSLKYKYISLQKLGKYVQAVSRVPIKVDLSIADRKVTVFCEDKPLGEVLERIGKTLFLDWVKDGTGYQLILNKQVAQEESAIIAHEAELSREAVMRYFTQCQSFLSSTPDRLKAEANDLENSFQTLGQDHTDLGKQRLQEAYDRYNLIQSFRYDRSRWDEGYMASQMTPQQIDGLLQGQPVFASTKQRPGVLNLPPEALADSDLAKQSFFNHKANELMIYARYDPLSEQLTINHRPLGFKDFGVCRRGGIDAPADATVLSELAKEPLVKRLVEWSKKEDSNLLKVRLDHDAEAPSKRPERVWTLAENLQWLHDRSGIPIVADAFRRFASYDQVPQASTVRGWLNAFNVEKYGQATWVPARVRSDSGWLMMRHRRYWQYLDSELPESALAPMEARAGSTVGLTIEDYAALAGSLSPQQEAWVNQAKLVVDFPAEPLYGNMPILKLWNSMSPTDRDAALDKGISYGELAGDGKDLYAHAFTEMLWNGLIDESVLPYFLPSPPPFPAGMSLFASPNTESDPTMGPDNLAWVGDRGDGKGMNFGMRPYVGMHFTLGLDRTSRLVYQVALKPLKH